MAELESIGGTGKDDRVTKADILAYVKDREEGNVKAPVVAEKKTENVPVDEKSTPVTTQVSASKTGTGEIVEMDRMRKLIADHMVMSKKTSPHITSYVEVDMTPIVEK